MLKALHAVLAFIFGIQWHADCVIIMHVSVDACWCALQKTETGSFQQSCMYILPIVKTIAEEVLSSTRILCVQFGIRFSSISNSIIWKRQTKQNFPFGFQIWFSHPSALFRWFSLHELAGGGSWFYAFVPCLSNFLHTMFFTLFLLFSGILEQEGCVHGSKTGEWGGDTGEGEWSTLEVFRVP